MAQAGTMAWILLGMLGLVLLLVLATTWLRRRSHAAGWVGTHANLSPATRNCLSSLLDFWDKQIPW